MIIWSAPATESMFATSLAEIGARLCMETKIKICLNIVVIFLPLFGNEQWRAVDSIKHCEKRLPLK